MQTETLEFKTELKQVLDIIIHSLYTHKEIFLRELISNASDAIDKIRFDSLTKSELLEDESNWKIEISLDKDRKTFTVMDNGIGMSRDSIVEDLGTIARSGSKEFLEGLKQADVKDRPELIGQFGVGFYSSFMVADEVSVVSRVSKGKGVKWTSKGDGTFTVEDVEKEIRGTEVTLHLKSDATEFLEPYRIKEVVKKFSNFIEQPIVMDNETLNTRTAIWLRPKADINESEYNDFYKHISHDTHEPAKVIHYHAEGALEFKALIFIPQERPIDLMWSEPKSELHLYINRVFIGNKFDRLLPGYLRFVKGVVDASDLPLNVSREMLQENPLLDKIRKSLVSKILSALKEMKNKEYDKYLKFYYALGMMLKEGISQDWENREKIADLLLFESTKTESGSKTTLADYVNGMVEDQKDIYYLAGENRLALEKSPYLEVLKEKGYEILFMTDPLDEFFIPQLGEYKGKKFKGADKVDSDDKGNTEKEEYVDFLKYLDDKFENIKEARISKRLKDSAACLVRDEGVLSAQMEAAFKKMGHETPESKKILEINPNHTVIKAMRAMHQENRENQKLQEYARILYDQALIAEGSKLRDPMAFIKCITDLLERDSLR